MRLILQDVGTYRNLDILSCMCKHTEIKDFPLGAPVYHVSDPITYMGVLVVNGYTCEVRYPIEYWSDPFWYGYKRNLRLCV